MRRRGFSLALVLLIATIALAVGTAMAAVSSMSLNLAMQEVGHARAQALARGVVAQVRYELDKQVWTRPEGPVRYPDMSMGNGAVRERLQTLPLFPEAEQQAMRGGLKAWVDFDNDRFYSVDNLLGGDPTASYFDRGTDRKSVPPYALDLVINTGVGDDPASCADPRHFEAVVTRVWPFSAYALSAPLVISGGSRVRGSAYDFRCPIVLGETRPAMEQVQMKGDVCVGLTREKNPVRIQEGTLQGRVRYDVPPWGNGRTDPLVLLSAPMLLQPLDGPLTPGWRPEYKPIPYEQRKHFAQVGDFQRFLGGSYTGDVGRHMYNETNELLDKVTVYHGDPLTPVKDLNQYRGHLNFRLPYDNRANEGQAANDANFYFARVLVDDLTLSDDYYETNSISNHFAVMNRTKIGDVIVETLAEDLWTGNKKGPATIHLDNAVLHVQGDLDLRDLSGDNSTLIVDGNLYLNGGRLDSGNKGMLILARNVYMEARGDFRGLIAARDNLWLKPLKQGERLVLHGALVTGGFGLATPMRDAVGTVLLPASTNALCVVNSTTLMYDSKYTRALNRLGVTRTSLFRTAP